MTSGQPSVEGSQHERFSRVRETLHQFLAEHAVPGGVLAVTHGGSNVLNEGFGQFTYEQDSPAVTAETPYDIASLTKVLATTAMAMLLYERGKLQLDAPVSQIIPEILTGDTRRAQITFRMLLAHSSGLPGYARLFEQASSREQLLARCFTLPLEADPGARAEYSDIGFIILGVALERLAGDTLDAFCKREIFTPLKMAQTCFRPPEWMRKEIPSTENDITFRKRVIQGEVHDENAWVLGGVAGHAGLFAPAEDVGRFALCMRRGGSPILKKSTVDLFTRRQETPAGTSRALGWDTPSPPSQSGKYFSESSFGHLGFTGTSLWIDPVKEVSITLLTIRTWPDRSSERIRQLRPAIHDAIMETLGLT